MSTRLSTRLSARQFKRPNLHPAPQSPQCLASAARLLRVTLSLSLMLALGPALTHAAPYPLADTFKLHSNPGASKTIYLDFDGHTTSGTSWNTSYNNGNDIVTPQYSTDNNVNTFSNSEKTSIQTIWQRTSEDFYPFDVDVTTEAPSSTADLKKSGIGDTKWGVRVAIGGSSDDWFTDPNVDGDEAGGVAQLNSFTDQKDVPTFVFENNVGNGDAPLISEAASHEAGHTLGLHHDGRGAPHNEEYYGGHGSGRTAWAPLMGTSYGATLSQWSKGEYKDANENEDDLSIITTGNGFGYRPDDHGDDRASASALAMVNGTDVSDEGFIGKPNDQDYFSFAHGGGELSLDIAPFEPGPNLDVEATLLDAAGATLATANPVDDIDAQLSDVYAAGTYFLAIDGVGKGNPITNGTGYTDYGSLGRYTITGSIGIIPEPATALLLLLGAAGMSLRRRRAAG